MNKAIDWELKDITQQVYITPELAAEILSKNRTNRLLRKRTVFNYSMQMTNNEWRQNNPQPIVLRSDGYLLDGQHRLTAVINSGKTLSWNVYIMSSNDKLPMDIMVDMGLKRNYADMLNLDLNVVSTVRKLLYYSTYGSGFNPSMEDVYNFYNKFIKNDELIIDLLKKKIKPLWSNSDVKSVALLYYLSDPFIKDYVVDIISSILNKEIDSKHILQKVFIKISERSYNNLELTKIAMILFNPKFADNKIVKLVQDVSIQTFYRKGLDEIGFDTYYKKLLPFISTSRGNVKLGGNKNENI